MAQTFEYSLIKINEEIFRPLIPIKIIHPANPNLNIFVLALLDTGADACVFPKSICDALQYNLKQPSAPHVINQGVGEIKVELWKHNFKIQLISPDLKSVIWTSKERLISCADHNAIPPLLGFADFLRFFKITFNYPGKKIAIEIPSDNNLTLL